MDGPHEEPGDEQRRPDRNPSMGAAIFGPFVHAKQGCSVMRRADQQTEERNDDRRLRQAQRFSADREEQKEAKIRDPAPKQEVRHRAEEPRTCCGSRLHGDRFSHSPSILRPRTLKKPHIRARLNSNPGPSPPKLPPKSARVAGPQLD